MGDYVLWRKVFFSTINFSQLMCKQYCWYEFLFFHADHIGSNFVLWNALFLLKIFFFPPVHRSDKLSMYIVMMTKEESTKIENFMTPRGRGCGHISHIVKMHYSFKNLAFNRQTKYIVMMTMEGSNRNYSAIFGEK